MYAAEVQFAVPFACALLVICLTERAMNAALCLAFKVSQWKHMSAQQVLVRQVELWAGVFTLFTSTFTSVVLSLLRFWVYLFAIFIFFAAIHVTYEEYPAAWVDAVAFYNANLGPWVDEVILVPLQFLDAVLRGLLPLYDAVFWWLKSMFAQGILPILIREAKTLFQMATVILDLSRTLGASLLTFTQSFDCSGAACLIPEPFVVDFFTPLGHLREFVALSIQLIRNFCGWAAPPIDILLYPFLDLNLATGIHSFFNSILQFTVVLPFQSSVRCSLAQNNTFQLMLCTPDFVPSFSYLVQSFSYFGLLIDNWVNIALVVTQAVLSGTTVTCDSASNALSPGLFVDAAHFGTNASVVVGLTSWMYAVTDGYSALYVSSDESLGLREQLWPYAADPSLGFAAVAYASVSDLDASSLSGGRTVGSLQTTAMLGCNCTDIPGSIEILCFILPYTGVPANAPVSNYLLQVLFPDEITAPLLGTCASIDLSVHSNRFSATRYESQQTTANSIDCVSRGTCREVDATVYLTPRSSNPFGANSVCFPFCMAVRLSGSANNNLQLWPASRWRRGYTVLQQDCATASSRVGNVGTAAGLFGPVSTVSNPPSTLTSGVATGIFISTVGPICTPAARITSQIDASKPTAARSAARLSGQPLFTTGDIVFTERKLGDGVSSVVIERLTTDDKNMLTLDTLSQDFPALAPLSVQADEFTLNDPSHLLIPPEVSYAPTLAVSSRNYVFYASPPALQCLNAYLDYCLAKAQNSNANPKAGFILLSSYAPIRIYRVSAYRKCASYSCGSNLVAFAQFDGFHTNYLTSACDQKFNLSISSLEYLNEDNIAVVMRYTMTGEYDANTDIMAGPNSGYATYWLNPATMQVIHTCVCLFSFPFHLKSATHDLVCKFVPCDNSTPVGILTRNRVEIRDGIEMRPGQGFHDGLDPFKMTILGYPGA